MLFNLIFFRGLISNLLTENEGERWSWTSLLPFWITSTMIFGNLEWLGSLLLFAMRGMVLVKIIIPVVRESFFNTGPGIYRMIKEKVRDENSNALKVVSKMAFDRICRINPTPQVILQALFKSVIIKGKVITISA